MAQPYHVGLHFLDEPVTNFTAGNLIFVPEFSPFILTDSQTEASVAGGWSSVTTESEARRRIALRVEDHFREVPTGDPETTLAISIYDELVPTDRVGRRVNVGLGAFEFSPYLGTAILDAIYAPGQVPQDDYGAVVYLDQLDELGGLGADLGTLSNTLNLFAGTTSHEVGHMFGLEHVDRGATQPYPLMSTGGFGFTIPDRTTDRVFSDEPDIQPGGESSVSFLTSNVPAVHRADFNMDNTIDLDDASALVGNFGQNQRLFQEGDTDGDHDVDLDDASLLVGGFDTTMADTAGTESVADGTAAADTPVVTQDTADTPGSAVWTFDAVVYSLTTTISIDVANQALLSTTALDGATLALLQQAVDLSTSQPDPGSQVGEFITSNSIAGQEVIEITVPDYGVYTFEAVHNVMGGGAGTHDIFQIEFIPEPSGVALMAIGGLALLRRRRVSE